MDKVADSAPVRPRAAARPRAADRFERLWSECYAPVHAYAARRVGAHADEVCAEVFLVAWRRLDRVPAEPLPWLLGTARNVIGTLWRGEARREGLRARIEGEPQPHAATPAICGDPALERALARLDERDREIVLLVHWDDLSPADAARVLGLAPATARTRLWRARRRLQALLAEEAER